MKAFMACLKYLLSDYSKMNVVTFILAKFSIQVTCLPWQLCRQFVPLFGIPDILIFLKLA